MGTFLGFAREKQINRVMQIPVSEITPNPHQPRTEFDEADIIRSRRASTRTGCCSHFPYDDSRKATS